MEIGVFNDNICYNLKYVLFYLDKGGDKMSKTKEKFIIAILLNSILILSFAGCKTQKQASKAVNSNPAADNTVLNNSPIKIQYLGHSAFVFSDQKKTKIGIDFWSPSVTYYAKDIPKGLGITKENNITKLLISHEHEDHNYIPYDQNGVQIISSVIHGIIDDDVKDNPKVAKIDNTIIGKYKAYHYVESAKVDVADDTVFVINMNNIKMVHLGDGFGAMADKTILDKLKKKIGDIDILFMPIGISSKEKVDQETLKNTMEILDPKIVIPMHYFTMDQKAQFLSDAQKANYTVENINENCKTISKNDLQSISKKVIWSIKPDKYSN
jgi:L-ascorbate metabolism protein UlaG (beta-lactamase superfamily)